jgi:cAMP-dependent protein kinase regulator
MGCGSSAQKKKYEEPAADKAGAKPDDKKPDAAATTAAAAPTTAAAAPTAAADAKPAAAAPATAAETPAAAAPTTAAPEEKEEESDAGEDDTMDDEEFERQIAAQAAKPRNEAISAEALEADPDWVAPEHPKTDEQKARLTAALLKSFMFAALQAEELEKVIKAFVAFPAEADQVVITQGAEVNSTEPALFVLEEGEADVYKTGVEAPVFTYTKQGQSFGELALLYNAPRAATVKAKTACQLWAIDRNTFNYLVKDAARQSKDRRVKFLKDVPLLGSLEGEEVSKLADALEVLNVETGKEVIKEGDEGKDFYIVEMGTLVAKKGGEVVLTYEPKGYFGELALLRDAPRAATISTTTACRLLKLDRPGFQRLLGANLNADMEKRAAELYTEAGLKA